MKLVPTDSALNSASRNLTNFFQNYRRGTKKTARFEHLRHCCDLLPQNWKLLEPNHFTESRSGIVWVKKDMSNFDSDPLTYDPVLFPAKYGQKVQILGSSLFHSAKLDHIWGSKSPKTSHKGQFHGCWIDTQNFENFKFDNRKDHTDEIYYDYISSWDL